MTDLGGAALVPESTNDDSREGGEGAEKTEAEEKRELFGLPLSMFVKGGTTTSAHDRHIAEIEADAERRRDEAAVERRLASIPIEEGGARIYTNKLTENASAQAGYVLLRYMTPGGDVLYDHGQPVECLADVNMVSATELCLRIVCLGCKLRGVPQGQAQLDIRQSNKQFELDVTKAGELILFRESVELPDGSIEEFVRPYRSAGVVRESERFRCRDCGWTARIVDNTVRPE